MSVISGSAENIPSSALVETQKPKTLEKPEDKRINVLVDKLKSLSPRTLFQTILRKDKAEPSINIPSFPLTRENLLNDLQQVQRNEGKTSLGNTYLTRTFEDASIMSDAINVLQQNEERDAAEALADRMVKDFPKEAQESPLVQVRAARGETQFDRHVSINPSETPGDLTEREVKTHKDAKEIALKKTQEILRQETEKNKADIAAKIQFINDHPELANSTSDAIMFDELVKRSQLVTSNAADK